MKQFKYFTSQDWSNYIGPYLYRKLKANACKRTSKMKKVVCLIGALLIISGCVALIPFFVISLFFGLKE